MCWLSEPQSDRFNCDRKSSVYNSAASHDGEPSLFAAQTFSFGERPHANPNAMINQARDNDEGGAAFTVYYSF